MKPTPRGSDGARMNQVIETIVADLRGPAVLLAVPRGKKAPRAAGWQKHTLADMTRPEYLASLNHGGNVGVLLGHASAGLCALDFDFDADADLFLCLNPALASALRTRGARGCQVWVRIEGEFPPSGDAKDEAGRKAAEWRADGRQSIIAGVHPSGVDYRRLVDAPPAALAFDALRWPEGWRLPWKPEPVQVPRARPADEDQSVIILPSGEVGILDCAEKLFPKLAATRRIFTRGGVVVELSNAGTLEIVRPAALRSRLETAGRVVAWRKGRNGVDVLQPVVCPEDIAKALLESLPARELLPSIASVVGCPVAVEDANGNLRVLGHGYHPERGGLLVTGGAMPPRVPLAEAAAALAGLLKEFDFVTPSDHSRALAAFVAPALSIGGILPERVPADVAEADQSQSGKGYRQKLIAAIYGETLRVVAQRNGGVGGLDESFSQALLEGRPFVQFDNLRGALDSTFLESFLTADSAPARVPHRGEVQVDPRRFFIMASSNGVETTGDFANRSSIVRIRKRPAGRSWHEFPEGDLLAHVRARQPYFIGCVFAVAAEWLAHGKPRTTETRHDFRPWAQALDWIVQKLFESAPLLDGHRAAQERVSNPALNFLRAVALAADRAHRLGESFTASNLAELAESAGVPIPGLRQVGDERAAAKQIGIHLGRVFREGDGEAVEVDGFTIRRTEREEAREDGNGVRLLKAYEIQRA